MIQSIDEDSGEVSLQGEKDKRKKTIITIQALIDTYVKVDDIGLVMHIYAFNLVECIAFMLCYMQCITSRTS